MDEDLYDQLDKDNEQDIREYVNSLNSDIKDTIWEYTHNMAEDMNRAILEDDIDQEVSIHIERLDNALSGVPPITRPVTLYRGVKFFPDINIRTFMSTSYSAQVTSKFIGGNSNGKICCLLRIMASAGTKILPIDTISRLPYEKEVLLARTGDFILTNAGFESYNRVYGYDPSERDMHRSISREILVYDLTYIP
jgi:hypothetical protein